MGDGSGFGQPKVKRARFKPRPSRVPRVIDFGCCRTARHWESQGGRSPPRTDGGSPGRRRKMASSAKPSLIERLPQQPAALKPTSPALRRRAGEVNYADGLRRFLWPLRARPRIAVVCS